MNAVGCIYLLSTTGLYVYPLPRSETRWPISIKFSMHVAKLLSQPCTFKFPLISINNMLNRQSCINLIHDSNKCWALVNTALNLHVL